MQLVLINNRIVAHGEGFIAMGGVVINTETGKKYEHATIAECSGCPSDIGVVGYEYHAGRFAPCAPFGKGTGNIAVYCDDCKTPRDSGVSVKLVCAMSSYLTFAGNVNADMVAAAFGQNNEDDVTGIGKALTMYSRFKGEDIKFSVLQNYDSLNAIATSQDAINEALSSTAIVAIMQASEYSRLYVDLWRLNAALPEEYRRASFADIIQDVEIMGYMYDNYATYEALNIFTSSSFINYALQYVSDTGYVSNNDSNVDCTIYGKKCLLIKLQVEKRSAAGQTNSGGTADIGYRPNGTGTVTSMNYYFDSNKAYGSIISKNVGLFCSNVTLKRIAYNYSNQPLKALYIPCE